MSMNDNKEKDCNTQKMNIIKCVCVIATVYVIAYVICAYVFDLNYLIATVVAWGCTSILFYFADKKYGIENKVDDNKIRIIINFAVIRAMMLAEDIAIKWFFIEYIKSNTIFAIIVFFIVVVASIYVYVKILNWEIIIYLIVGVLTTVIYMIVYYLCRIDDFMGYGIATCIAWIVAVVFAFYANKYWVFDSKKSDHMIEEFIKFMACRLASLGLDIATKWIMLDILGIKEIITVITAQIIVIVINYVFSKFFVFVKKSKKEAVR